MQKTQAKKVAIVGAGLTGLTAAYLLAKHGRDCILLEKENKVGGMSRSYKIDGLTFDLGPHLFFPNPNFPAERFMLELLHGEKIIKRRFRFAIYNNQQYWKFPISIFDMVFYPWRYKKHFLLNYLKKGQRVGSADVSAKDDIVTKSGPAYYQEVFAAMFAKKTLSPGDRIHKDWLARIDRDINNRKEGPKEASHSGEVSHVGLIKKIINSFFQTYYYPAQGFAIFPFKLLEKFHKAGGRTILDCGPIRFHQEDDVISTVTIKDHQYPVDNVIWTGSVNSLNNVLGKDNPKLNYVKTTIILLTYNQKNFIPRPFIYVYYPEENIIFNRVYFPAGIYREDASAGREGICLEINHGDEIDHLDENELIKLAVADVELAGLFNKTDFREGHVIRLDECMPIYSLDYEQEMSASFKDIWRYKNLYSVGRLGGYFFCLSPPAVSQGMKVAEHILRN